MHRSARSPTQTAHIFSTRAPRCIASGTPGTFALDRHPYRRAQSPERAIGQDDVAAVGAGDVARDREPEAGAAFVLIARVVEAQERLEYLFTQMRCDAGAVVIPGDGEPPVGPGAADHYRRRWRP